MKPREACGETFGKQCDLLAVPMNALRPGRYSEWTRGGGAVNGACCAERGDRLDSSEAMRTLDRCAAACSIRSGRCPGSSSGMCASRFRRDETALWRERPQRRW